MIRWSYGYRYLLAPEGGYKQDIEQTGTNGTTQRYTLHRHQTMESDENTPLFRPDNFPRTDHPPHRHSYTRQSRSRNSTNAHSRQTSTSEIPSDYDHSTADTSPLLISTPLLAEQESDITSFPPPSPRLRSGWASKGRNCLAYTWREFLEFMNMPLWAMLVAVLIALYPQLQRYLFFQEGGFIRGSVIYAIQTCGDVSIPLILVILGANLANDDDITHSTGEEAETAPVTDRKWPLTQRQRGIILAVATRMVIVPLIICPLTIPVALWGVRYHMGVLCDPIFWVVCWLLVGSPTAVQLTQITQLNNVFEGEMALVSPPLLRLCTS